MNNRDKEIRKLMAEKGFDSFDDLSERLNNFPETRSAKDIEDELAKLKLQLINPQPLFTLTAEEVEAVESAIVMELGSLQEVVINNYETIKAYPDKYGWYLPKCDILDNLLTRIKQWQDEHNKQRPY